MLFVFMVCLCFLTSYFYAIWQINFAFVFSLFPCNIIFFSDWMIVLQVQAVLLLLGGCEVPSSAVTLAVPSLNVDEVLSLIGT